MENINLLVIYSYNKLIEFFLNLLRYGSVYFYDFYIIKIKLHKPFDSVYFTPNKMFSPVTFVSYFFTVSFAHAHVIDPFNSSFFFSCYKKNISIRMTRVAVKELHVNCICGASGNESQRV